jgi:hypothetical protein
MLQLCRLWSDRVGTWRSIQFFLDFCVDRPNSLQFGTEFMRTCEISLLHNRHTRYQRDQHVDTYA